MSLNKVVYTNNETVITAENLNEIQDSIITLENGGGVTPGKKTDDGGEIFNDYDNNSASTTAHAEGTNTNAFGESSHAEGYSTDASGSQSHAEGANTIAAGDSSHAEGEGSTALGNASHAEGYQSNASGKNSHAEGSYTNTRVRKYCNIESASESNTGYTKLVLSKTPKTLTIGKEIFIGSNNLSDKTIKAVITQVQKDVNSITVFSNYNSDYTYSWIVVPGDSSTGTDDYVDGDTAHVEGYNTIAVGDNQHVQGKYNEIDFDTYAHIVGNGTSDTNRSNAHTLDWNGNAWFAGDVRIGGGDYATPNVSLSSLSNGLVGKKYNSNGGEVFNSYSYGEYYDEDPNIASGKLSHAEGRKTEASEEAAHAEGRSTIASAYGSHAEGMSTRASGDSSHAEGEGTYATGGSSHAEGCFTKASGDYSHAEGYYTTASGKFSHAEGLYTIANGAQQHVQGKYNIEDNDNKYVHIVGNGAYDDKNNLTRSNAHTLDWDGNAWFAGDVESEKYGKLSEKASTKEINSSFTNVLKGSKFGSSICLDDISPVEHEMSVRVNSKNLIPYPYTGTTFPKTVNGITFTCDDNGWITVNGTTTADVFLKITDLTDIIDKNKTYVLSGSSVISLYISFYQDNTWIRSISSINGEAKIIDFSMYSGIKYNNIILLMTIKHKEGGTTVDGVTLKPQLELGTTATEWTPYISLSAVNVKSYGKNLIPYPYNGEIVSNGITYTINDDRSISASGTATSNSAFMFYKGTGENIIDKKATYTLSASTNTNNIRVLLGIYKDNTNLKTFQIEGTSNIVIDFAQYDFDTIKIYCSVEKDTSITNGVLIPQLELGTSVTRYTNYIEPSSYTLQSNGTIEKVKSIYPATTLLCDKDNMVIEVEYNRDINKAFEELQNAILAQGGNV